MIPGWLSQDSSMSNSKPCQLPEICSISAYFGCCKENPLDWAASTTDIISHSSRGWEDQDQDTSRLSVCWMLASWLVVVWQLLEEAEEVKELFRVSFIGALTSFMRAPPSQRPHLHIPSQNRNLGRQIVSLQHMVSYLICPFTIPLFKGTS